MGNFNSKTVISQCLNWLDIPEWICSFLDYRTQKLTCRAAILLGIEAQLSGRQDPESIVYNLQVDDELKALTGLTSLSASQFSRGLNEMPTFLLQYLLQSVSCDVQAKLREARPGARTDKTIPKLSIIDSSSIPLPEFHGKWAYCSKDRNSVKLHLRLSTEWPDLAIPNKVILSTGAVTDSEVAVELVTEQGTTYVMDRGYINYAHYKKWLDSGILFVARLQTKNKTRILETRLTPEEESDLLLDADVLIQVTKKPETTIKLRLVEFKDEKNRVYRLITSNWELTAREIADIYRERWGIELFFKWMKQNLHLSKLYSYKPNAVWNQIYLALIAHALCVLVKLHTGAKQGLCQILKLMRVYISRSWEMLLAALFREPTKTSQGRRKKPKRGRKRLHPEKKKGIKVIIRSEENNQ